MWFIFSSSNKAKYEEFYFLKTHTFVHDIFILLVERAYLLFSFGSSLSFGLFGQGTRFTSAGDHNQIFNQNY